MVHPIVAAAGEIDAALKSCADANPTFMVAEEKADTLRELAALEARLGELRLRVMAAAGEVAESTGARDVAAWFATATMTRLEDARREERLARLLDREYALLARGVREGVVSLAQAQVIAHALSELPRETAADVVPKAEEVLVDHATRLGPRELRRLGQRILEVVAPEIADAAEAKRLLKLEADARRATRLNLRRQGDGTTRIWGRISDAAATRLATYLEAFANPRKSNAAQLGDALDADAADTGSDGEDAADPVGRLPYPRRLGEAFTQLLECLDPTRMPIHGGDATTVVVTLSLDDLRHDLAAADLLSSPHVPGDGEASLTAGEVRRLACNAHIIPAVLGASSEVLDLGRRQRLFTAAQRKALLIRDRHCRAVGCDIPGTWSEAHHWIPWQQGGKSDLDNAVLLCNHHHQRAHDPTYQSERLPIGDVRYVRRL